VTIEFEFGVLLPDPDGILVGNSCAKQVRYARIRSPSSLPRAGLKRLLRAAVSLPRERSDRIALVRSGARLVAPGRKRWGTASRAPTRPLRKRKHRCDGCLTDRWARRNIILTWPPEYPRTHASSPTSKLPRRPSIKQPMVSTTSPGASLARTPVGPTARSCSTVFWVSCFSPTWCPSLAFSAHSRQPGPGPSPPPSIWRRLSLTGPTD
jgi:hypothetical protein